MRQNLRNSRARRSVAGRQWRSNFASTLAEDLGRAVDELGSQVVAGWGLLLDDVARASSYRPGRHAPDDFSKATTLYAVRLHDDAADDPLDAALRAVAVNGGICAAPDDLAARVRSRLPASPPPWLSPNSSAVHSESPYAAIAQHARVVFGAVSVSAVLSFVTSWLIAATVPSLALTVLATLVTVGLLLVEGARLAVQMTAGAVSNPVVVLLAMLGPLIIFLTACTQLARISRLRLA